jgi:hypothetical protein
MERLSRFGQMNQMRNSGVNIKLYNPNVSFNKAKMSLISNFSLYSDYYQENNIRDHTNSFVS